MRLRPAASAAPAAGLLALVPASRAQDTVARSLAATCANCRGTDSVSAAASAQEGRYAQSGARTSGRTCSTARG